MGLIKLISTFWDSPHKKVVPIPNQATNMNLFGEMVNEKKNYDTTVGFMKKYQPWNVQSKMNDKDIFKMAEDFNKIKKAYPSMDQQMMWNIQKLMMQQYKNMSPNATLPQSLLQ